MRRWDEKLGEKNAAFELVRAHPSSTALDISRENDYQRERENSARANAAKVVTPLPGPHALPGQAHAGSRETSAKTTSSLHRRSPSTGLPPATMGHCRTPSTGLPAGAGPAAGAREAGSGRDPSPMRLARPAVAGAGAAIVEPDRRKDREPSIGRDHGHAAARIHHSHSNSPASHPAHAPHTHHHHGRQGQQGSQSRLGGLEEFDAGKRHPYAPHSNLRLDLLESSDTNGTPSGAAGVALGAFAEARLFKRQRDLIDAMQGRGTLQLEIVEASDFVNGDAVIPGESTGCLGMCRDRGEYAVVFSLREQVQGSGGKTAEKKRLTSKWAEGTVNDNGVPVVRWADRNASVLAFHDVAVSQSQLIMQLVYQRKSGLFCGGGISNTLGSVSTLIPKREEAAPQRAGGLTRKSLSAPDLTELAQEGKAKDGGTAERSADTLARVSPTKTPRAPVVGVGSSLADILVRAAWHTNASEGPAAAGPANSGDNWIVLSLDDAPRGTLMVRLTFNRATGGPTNTASTQAEHSPVSTSGINPVIKAAAGPSGAKSTPRPAAPTAPAGPLASVTDSNGVRTGSPAATGLPAAASKPHGDSRMKPAAEPAGPDAGAGTKPGPLRTAAWAETPEHSRGRLERETTPPTPRPLDVPTATSTAESESAYAASTV